MIRWTMLSILTVVLAAHVLVPEARTQGICWDGTLVQDLKDCPRRPGSKLQSNSGQDKGADAAAQGSIKSQQKTSKSVDMFIKMAPIKGEAK